jgi:hypothetical protein
MNTSVNFQGLGRIIFTFQKKHSKDDTLTVVPDTNSDGYNVTFVQNTMHNKTESHLANSELIPYLNRLFNVMMFDVAPYDCVQIDCPSFPTVVIEMYNIMSYVSVLTDQINSMQTHWPQEKSGLTYAFEGGRASKTFTGDGRILVTLIKDNKKDDILSIQPEACGYNVRFEQAELINETENFVYTNDLPAYISRFFTAVMYDAEPHECIQVDFPLYPTVLIKHEDLASYLPHLINQIMTVVDWPTEISGKREMLNPRSEYDWDVLGY